MPSSSGFAPLPSGFEPNPTDVFAAVRSDLNEAADMSELCFAGAGEPLLRLRTLEECANLLGQEFPELKLRVNTNGLLPDSEAADVANRLLRCGVRAASVALVTADPEQYMSMMQPDPLRLSPAFSLPLGHKEVCGFVTAAIDAGLAVECSAVENPEVDVAAAKSLAVSLGATFRSRTWHPGDLGQ